MKKTLLALAVFAAAGSAQAVEVYNQDGLSVQFQGDFEFRYVKGYDKDDNLKMDVNDADLGFDVRYAVNDDFSIGGYVQYQGDKDGVISSNTNNGNAYVGFYTADYGSLKFGKLDIILDDLGVGSDEIFGISSWVGDLEANSNEAVRYDIDKGMFYGGASFVQNAQDANTKGLSRDHNFDFKAGVRVAGFDFLGYYGESVAEGNIEENKLSAFEARFGGIENVNLELGYYYDDFADSDQTADTVAFAADYTMNAWKFGAGVASHDYNLEYVDANGDKVEDYVDWFANVSYMITANAKLYTEIGGDDKDDSELGYGFGIEASF